jgi:hypothetical protein
VADGVLVFHLVARRWHRRALSCGWSGCLSCASSSAISSAVAGDRRAA